MSQETTIKYYVRWADWEETIPQSLFRLIADDQGYPIDEQVWNQTNKIWSPTISVTESMFRGGNVEPTTVEFAQKSFPEAFKA